MADLGIVRQGSLIRWKSVLPSNGRFGIVRLCSLIRWKSVLPSNGRLGIMLLGSSLPACPPPALRNVK